MMVIYVSQEFYKDLKAMPELEKNYRYYQFGDYPIVLDEDLPTGWYIKDENGDIIKTAPSVNIPLTKKA